MPGPAFASGDSVSLHPIEEEDCEFIQYGRNHPDVRRSFSSSTIRTRDDVAADVEDEEYRFLVCLPGEDDPEPVGLVGLPWVFEDTKSAFLMYWIAPEHQGNGYVTEATELLLDYVFRERGFHKVAAYIHETNDGSRRVLEKLGFEREGTLRQEVFADGEWIDEYRYAVLADEWLDA